MKKSVGIIIHNIWKIFKKKFQTTNQLWNFWDLLVANGNFSWDEK